MTIFLLVISFIIDGVLIIGLLTILTRVKKTEEFEFSQKQVANEIEDLFTSYLMEIKDENNRMSELLKKAPDETGRFPSAEKNPGSQEIKEEAQATWEEPQPSKKDYDPPQPEEEIDLYQPSLHSQIMELKDKGYEIEDIAKKLNKGKTEIELLLKFQQKK